MLVQLEATLMTIIEGRQTGVGPKVVYLFGESLTRLKPHERGADADGEERRSM